MSKETAMAAVRTNPKDAQAWLRLSEVLEAAGDIQRARECLMRARTLIEHEQSTNSHEPKASLSRHLNYHVLIDESFLVMLDASLVNSLKVESEYAVRFIDGSRITYASIQEVLRLPNTGKRRIEQIDISGHAYSKDSVCDYISIYLDSSHYILNRYHVSTRESQLDYVVEQIERELQRGKMWYSRLASESAMFFAVFIAILGLSSLPLNLSLYSFLLLGIGVLLMAIIWGLPRTTFVLGYGKQRHHLRITVLGVIIGTVILGGLVNICTSLIVR